MAGGDQTQNFRIGVTQSSHYIIHPSIQMKNKHKDYFS